MLDVTATLHTLLRWPILVVGLAGALHAATSWAQSVDGGRLGRIISVAFIALLDLQVVLGVALLVLAPSTRQTGATHALVMLLAVVAAHLLRIRARRAAPPLARRLSAAVFLLPLALILLALTLLS